VLLYSLQSHIFGTEKASGRAASFCIFLGRKKEIDFPNYLFLICSLKDSAFVFSKLIFWHGKCPKFLQIVKTR
jgi:hypothetical protein